MKLFYYIISQHALHTLSNVGITVGVIQAKDLSEAEKSVCKKLSPNCALKSIEELDVENGWEYTVYGSSFR